MARGMHKPKKLAARIRVFEEHGQNPPMGKNPSNGNGTGQNMRKPGSYK